MGIMTGKSSEELKAIENRIVTSFSARAIAVRKVTSNKGRKTPGIDKIL